MQHVEIGNGVSMAISWLKLDIPEPVELLIDNTIGIDVDFKVILASANFAPISAATLDHLRHE